MTDKVQKIRNEVERLRKELIQEKEKGFGSDADDTCILELQNVLTYIDSVQEEPLREKKCMFTKDNYTDEDRKVLCEDCDEKCECSKKEEPVIDDTEEAIEQSFTYHENRGDDFRSDKQIETAYRYGFKTGASWQKEKDFQYVKKECKSNDSCCDNDIAIEAAKRHPYCYASEMEAYANIGFKEGAMWQMSQIMKDATGVTVHIDAGGYPYIPQMELYDYYKDIPLAKEGDKYKVILIKED